MKTIFKSALVVLLFTASITQSVHAQDSPREITDRHIIGAIQLNAKNGTVYFRALGGVRWSTESCDPVYLYMSKDAVGYEQIMSLAVASKLNNSTMRFYGRCVPTIGTPANYFELDYGILD